MIVTSNNNLFNKVIKYFNEMTQSNISKSSCFLLEKCRGIVKIEEHNAIWRAKKFKAIDLIVFF
ncbi:hypothetical protein FCV41_13105 [Clostridium argentinense]|nr:hypothetical protein [Clostridium argentinense]